MFITHAKNFAQNIPYPVGALASKTPFWLRLGKEYLNQKRLIYRYESEIDAWKEQWLLKKLHAIVNFAQTNIPFYSELYGSDPIKIRRLDDFHKLPLIDKSMVRQYTEQSSGAMLINTGGSSGEPLGLYIDKLAWAREWAHLHYCWSKAGYHPMVLKLTLMGKNLGEDLYRYNAVHHEFILNTYKNPANHVNEILDLFEKYPIRFMHGYPSAIYSFLRNLDGLIAPAQKRAIASKIQSCLFSSEFPVSYMVEYIQNDWGIDYVSWYGHSEMCVLAWADSNSRKYYPLQTYGYAEVENGVLCGTSFNNYDMPLIRYKTGDIVCPEYSTSGLIESFEVTEGREGDFVLDKKGFSIALTALIFGRHHHAFDVVDFVQLYQQSPGYLSVFLVPKKGATLAPDRAHGLFDLRDVEIEFDFYLASRPCLTTAGKLKLLLTENQLKSWLKTKPLINNVTFGELENS